MPEQEKTMVECFNEEFDPCHWGNLVMVAAAVKLGATVEWLPYDDKHDQAYVTFPDGSSRNITVPFEEELTA